MSSLERMQVQGVRAFGPERPAVISFHKPLTLIVGSNGAGKTTLIESLRYATTGSMPPNSKDGFVHDPKLVNEREVRALVKLQFRNLVGAKVTIGRHMLLTALENGRNRFKTLDGTIEIENGDRKASISSRCADVNVEMSNQLGVSKAILENVIFCHQEDSLWPLGESSTVKKKFDEIFAATRYTQAIKEFEALKKEKTGDLKEARVDLVHLQTNREKAVEKRKEVEMQRGRIADAQAQMTQLRGEIETLNAQLAELDTQLQVVSDLELQQATILSKIDDKRAHLAELEPTIMQFEETEEQLLEILEEKRRELQAEEQSRAQMDQQKEQAQRAVRAATEEINAKHTLRGGQLEQQKNHQNNIVQRDRMIRHMAGQWKLGHVPAGDLRKEFVDEFVGKARNKHDEMRRGLERREADLTQHLRKLDDELVQLKTSAETSKAKAAHTKQQRSENLSKIQELESQAASIRVTDAMLKASQAATATAKEQLTLLTNQMRREAHDVALRTLETQRNEHDSELERLMSQQSRINTLAEDRARIDVLRTDILRERTSAEAEFELIRNVGADIGGAAEVTLANCEELTNAAVRRRQDVLNRAKTAAAEARDKFVGTRKTLEVKRTQLLQEENRIGDLMMENPELQPDMDLNGEIERVEKELGEAQANASFYTNMNEIYTRFMQMAKNKKRCPVCERSFGDHADTLDDFMEKVKKYMNSMPEQKRNADDELHMKEAERSRLRALQPAFSLKSDIQRRLPAMQQEVRTLEAKVAELERTNTDAMEAEQKAETVYKRVLAAQQNAKALAMRLDGVRKSESRVEALEDQLRSSDGTSVTGEELAQKMSVVRDNISKIKDQIAATRDQLTRDQDRLRRLEGEVTRKTQEETTMRDQLERRMRLLENVKQLEEDNAHLSHQQQELEGSAHEVESKLDERRRDHDKRSQATRVELDGLRKDLAEIGDELRRLAEKCEQIDSFTRAEATHGLAAIDAAIVKLEHDRDAASQRLKTLESQSQDRQERIAKIAQSQTQVNEFLRYNRMKREIEQAQQDIQRIEREKRQHGDPQQVHQQRRQCATQVDDLRQQLNRTDGTVAQLRLNVQAIERELHDHQFRNIDETYRKQHINVKTTEMAIADLDKYMKAVDRAVMSYHTMKMAEINKIIKELWIDVYEGQDIDAIEIAAEDEKTGAGSYNYRVVMIKERVKLDMRGRCSAGQKVLACLIIRLALAETFGLNCGVLALDEPTTNLDVANSERLASALDRIIKMRSKQNNFQLIVITHDENFMRKLRSHSDWFWQVRKDPDTHNSLIKKISMDDF